MRIIVQNKAEEELIHKFLLAVHELGIIDLMEEEDGKESGTGQMLNSDDYRILSEAISGDQVGVTVDESESELYYEESEFIEGVCSECRTVTHGLYDSETITYSRAIEIQSEEGQKNWQCHDCYTKSLED